jgi:hypothetical protein
MKNIEIKTGFSQKKNEEEAIKEIFEKIDQEKTKLIVAFFSSSYNQRKINESWQKNFSPHIPFVGISALGSDVPFFKIKKNVISEGFKEGVAAMSISSEKIDASVKLMKNIDKDWEKESSRALNEAAQDLNLDLQQADPKKYFGILSCDTLSSKEHKILENLYALSGLTFVGGGSSGSMSLKTWLLGGNMAPGFIHTNQGAWKNAGVLALVKCDIPFKIDLVTNFSPTNIKFTVTKSEGVLVHELDGKPAVEEYIKAIGVPRRKLGAKRFPNMNVFSNSLLGLMIKDKAYIRLVGTVKGNSLLMASPVKEGQTLYLMKKEDILETTREKMDNIKKELGSVSGTILFHCGMRMMEAEKINKLDELFKTMDISPLVGGCTFREYYGWLAMEYSLAILALGDL